LTSEALFSVCKRLPSTERQVADLIDAHENGIVDNLRINATDQAAG